MLYTRILNGRVQRMGYNFTATNIVQEFRPANNSVEEFLKDKIQPTYALDRETIKYS